MNGYLKKFNRDEEWREYKLSSISFSAVSRVLPDIIINMVLSTILLDSDYIVCPYYGKDFQIGITGKCKVGETVRSAIERELGEEVGVIPINKREIDIIDSYGCILNVNKVRRLSKYESKTYNTNSDDNRKVASIIYGTKEELFEIYKGDVYRYISEDNIIGVFILPVFFIKKCIYFLEQKLI